MNETTADAMASLEDQQKDLGAEITLANLTQTKQTGEVLNIEFDTSPRSGDGGNRTRVRRLAPRTSPGAVCYSFLSLQRHADLLLNRLSQLSVVFIQLT